MADAEADQPERIATNVDRFSEDLKAGWLDQIPTNVEAGRLTVIREAGPNML